MSRWRSDVGAHCPDCGTEYRPGFDTCADCDVALVPGPVPEPIPEPVMAPEATEPVAAWRSIGRLPSDEARLLAGRLQAEGIPARVDPEWESVFYGAGSPLDVLVAEDRVLEAQGIARDIAAGVADGLPD